MTLKTLTILLFTALLFSCSAQAGPRKSHHQLHHGDYHFKQHRHHHKHKHKHKRRKHDCRHQAHYRGAAYSPAYLVPGHGLDLRFGFPQGQAVIIYRSPYGY